jgi:hypothetical protein
VSPPSTTKAPPVQNLDNAPISETDRAKIAHACELFKLPHPSATSPTAHRVVDDYIKR